MALVVCRSLWVCVDGDNNLEKETDTIAPLVLIQPLLHLPSYVIPHLLFYSQPFPIFISLCLLQGNLFDENLVSKAGLQTCIFISKALLSIYTLI